MEQVDKNTIITSELASLIPKGLSIQEESIWRLCFNSLRLADFATTSPLGGEMIARLATIQTILAGRCSSMSGPVLDSQGKVIVLTCSNPNTNMEALLDTKISLLPGWTFAVNSHKDPEGGIYDKIDFVERKGVEMAA